MISTEIKAVANRGRSAFQSVRARLPARPRPTILMYHRVNEDPFDPWGTIVSAHHFAEQIAWLADRRTVLPLAQFAALQRAGDLPPEAVAITFDDGYACNVEMAAPMLNERHLPATMFLPAAWIARGGLYWWDEIRPIVLDNDGAFLRMGRDAIELGEKHPRDGVWRYGDEPATPRQRAFREVWLRLLLQTPAAIEDGMKELRQQFGGCPQTSASIAPMTPAQVRAAASNTIEFGSHAMRHPALTSLSRDDQAEEIRESVAGVEALSGVRPKSFAYPFGIFEGDAEHLVEEAGFECACSVESSTVSKASRTYALPRLMVGNWGSSRLKRALALLPSAAEVA